jgi:hypothetical protein
MLNSGLTMSPYISGFKRIDTGPSDFDFQQVLVVSYVWQLPVLKGSHVLVRNILGGWEVTGITSAQTGSPLALFAGTDRSQTGIGYDHVDYNGGSVSASGPCANLAPCVSFLVPGSFATPALGTYGNLAKGALRGPELFNTDMGAFKNFVFRERWNVQFRAEFFNVFNKANFNNPGTSINSGTFGLITSARDPRIGQLALKILF